MSQANKNHNLLKKIFIRPTPWKTMTMPVLIIVLATLIFFTTVVHLNRASQQQVLDEFITAARTGNVYAINKRTDWEELRTTMKEDLRRRAKSVLGQTTGHAMAPEDVDAMVDYYVTPANIPTLFYFRSEYASDINPSEFIRRSYFTSLSEFIVEIAYPPQGDKPWISYMEPVKLVFELEGMQWRLKKIIPPLYVVPKAAPGFGKMRASYMPSSPETAEP